MRLPLGIATSIMLLVAGCDNFSTSKMNPVNWFSGSAKVEMMEAPPADTGDPRPLVDEVLSMVVEPTSGGAIVRATGRTPTQGWWVAELVPEEDEPVDGRMTYRFVIAPPLQPTRVSTPASRDVTVAIFVTNYQLEFIREITVMGARSARSSRR